jgi:hypothetical protein
MGPVDGSDSFYVNLPVSVTGGAVIAVVICDVSLDLRGPVVGKIL